MNNTEAWEQINRMQRICMDKDSYITKHEFFSEPMEERRAFYNWMRNQVNQYQAAPYWAGDDKNPAMLSLEEKELRGSCFMIIDICPHEHVL